MKKGILIGLICFVFLCSTFSASLSTAEILKTNEARLPILSDQFLFTSCYIVASGYVSETDWPAFIKMPNMWKMTWVRLFNDNALMTYWQIVFDSSAEITIYDKEGGQLLWEQSGEFHQQVRIIGYYGAYVPSQREEENPLYIELSGHAFLVFRTPRA